MEERKEEMEGTQRGKRRERDRREGEREKRGVKDDSDVAKVIGSPFTHLNFSLRCSEAICPHCHL